MGQTKLLLLFVPQFSHFHFNVPISVKPSVGVETQGNLLYSGQPESNFQTFDNKGMSNTAA